MTWCHVRGHAECCRCDGSPETSDATLVERLREYYQEDGVDAIVLAAADRIEELEALLASEMDP